MDGFIFFPSTCDGRPTNTDTGIAESLRSERGFSQEHVVTGQGSMALH